jgi:hypothetical protein
MLYKKVWRKKLEKLYLILKVVGYIYYMMISEIDVMLQDGTLKIVCPV